MSLLKLEQTQDHKDYLIGSQLKTPASPDSQQWLQVDAQEGVEEQKKHVRAHTQSVT